MSIKSRIYAFALLAVAPWAAAQAANLPTPAISSSPGVSIHFTTGNTKDLDLMAAAGIKIVRTDFQWTAVESQKGVYNWAAYDELVNNIVARGMRPYFTLDYSNPLYETVHILSQNGVPYASYVDSPHQASSVAAFAAWAKAAAARYQSKGVIWEIWNEPNLDAYWKPTANVADYTTLSNAVCTAIHSAAPAATVVGGAIAEMDWNYIYAYLGSGILGCIDAFSVHAYRETSPETASANIYYLQWLISQYKPASRTTNIPLLSGEWGYPTQTNSAYSPALQASYAVRMQINNLLYGIPVSIWYDWKNDGTDPTNKEQNFGLVTATLAAKPSYTAMKVMSQQLSGYNFVRSITTSNSQDYVLVFANAAGKQKVVAWTLSPSYATTILPQMTTSNKTVTVVSMLGVSSSVVLTPAGMSTTLSDAPQYIDLSNL